MPLTASLEMKLPPAICKILQRVLPPEMRLTKFARSQ